MLDSGTERVSGERVRLNQASPVDQVIYAGTVEHWGLIDKSIPILPGMPQISDAQIRIKDNYRKWRDLLYAQTPRRRIMRITMLPEGGSLADYDPVFVGEVVDVRFVPAAIEIRLRDRMFAWLDEPLPAMAIPELYPYLRPEDVGGFIPIIFGHVRGFDESPSVEEGIIPLPHIGIFDPDSPSSPTTLRDRWAVAVHPVHEVISVYRRESVQTNADITQSAWVLVDPSEYEINEVYFAEDDHPFGPYEMWHTVLDFFEIQPEGTEIRADVSGIIDADASPPGPQRNPISLWRNITYLLLKTAGVPLEVLDTVEIDALAERFRVLGYIADGAITEPLTAREFLSRFLASFSLHMFVNRRGLITLRYPEEDQSPPVTTTFKEGKHIIRQSFVEQLPERIVNQVEYRFAYNNATNQWDQDSVIDSAEQSVIAMQDDESPSLFEDKVEKEVLDQYFIRDSQMALVMAERRFVFQKLGSYRQSFDMPLPATIAGLELAEMVNLTHSMGLNLGGYLNRQAMIYGITFDMDRLKASVKTVLFPAQTVTRPDQLRLRPQIDVYPPSAPYSAYSNIDDGGSFVDADDVSNPTTYADFTINATSPFADYSHAVLHSYPEPDLGETLVSVRLAVIFEYVRGSGTVIADQHPISTIKIKDHYPVSLTEAATALWESGSVSESKSEHYIDYSAGAFTSAFPGGAADIHLHVFQWGTFNSGALGGFGTHYMRCYDAWIEYTYA